MKRRRTAPSLSSALRAAIDALGYLDGLDVLEGPTWDAARERWVLRCRITIPAGTEARVPTRTTWVVLVEATYPAGGITIYPASVGGITDTFHHQNRNTPAPAGRPWRGGDICVHQGARALERLGGATEPLDGTARLAWRLGRAVAWVRAASTGTLVGPGDPFELPDFGVAVDGNVLGFAEDADSLRLWSGDAPGHGDGRPRHRARVTRGPHTNRRRCLSRPAGNCCLRAAVGLGLRTGHGRWGNVRPLGAPALGSPHPSLDETWGELVECAAGAGIDLDEFIAAASVYLRATGRGWLLFGFPMPARVGEADVEYFWQALRLPALTSTTGVLKGFRNTEKNRRFIDRMTRFRRDAPLTWVRSENWHPATRAARGRFSDALTGRRVLLVGGGAVGAVIAELLVRGGVENLTICDPETTLTGNLVRHTLTLRDVGRGKAVGLAERLAQASPQHA